MKKTLLGLAITLVWCLGLMVSETKAQACPNPSGCIYGNATVTLNYSSSRVEGYSYAQADYTAGLNFDPYISGSIYRTDFPETDLDYRTSTGSGSSIAAVINLSTTNFVSGKTYCNYTNYFAVRRSTGQISYIGYFYDCKTIPLPPPPPTPTPTPPPTATPTPTPCPDTFVACTDYSVSISINPLTVLPTGVSGGSNTANVSVCITPALANRSASFQLVRRPQHVDTAGHIESQHTGKRPVGKLASVSGVTGADGCLRTKYSPSHISGFVGINGSALGTSVGGDILVEVPELLGLSDGENYNLIGRSSAHPNNHNGTLAALAGLQQIADDYRSEYYGANPIPENAKLNYNDMSLTYGGKFDLGKGWSNAGAHAEHREGINADVRCCSDPGNIPRDRWAELNRIFVRGGSTRTNDETRTSAPHWHLRFEFGTPRVAERTPHSFVEDVFDASLQRMSTQQEYEVWLSRITNAKANGQNALLVEAKTFITERLTSDEYRARNRVGPDFIETLFWAHLFRAPTAAESQTWFEYWQSLPGFEDDETKKEEMIGAFQQQSEFESVVLGIVDASVPSQ